MHLSVLTLSTLNIYKNRVDIREKRISGCCFCTQEVLPLAYTFIERPKCGFYKGALITEQKRSLAQRGQLAWWESPREEVR